jgi:hypothetical protein
LKNVDYFNNVDNRNKILFLYLCITVKRKMNVK